MSRLKTEERLIIQPEVYTKIFAECSRLGYLLLKVQRHSDHPEDHYLFDVLGWNKERNIYATWMYNSSFDTLNNGHYEHSDFETAVSDYEKRGYTSKT